MNNSAHFLPVFVCQPQTLSLNSKHIYFVMINNILLEIKMLEMCIFHFLSWLYRGSFPLHRWVDDPHKIDQYRFNLTSGNENSNFLLWITKNDDEKLRRTTKDHIGEKNRVCGVGVLGISQIYTVLNSILHFGEIRLSPRNPHPSFVSGKNEKCKLQW